LDKDIIQGVYKITNINNGKIYIGRSIDIYRRWKEHKRELIKGIHKNKDMQFDYLITNKEDIEDIFEWEIIEIINDHTYKWQELIHIYKTPKDQLYNVIRNKYYKIYEIGQKCIERNLPFEIDWQIPLCGDVGIFSWHIKIDLPDNTYCLLIIREKEHKDYYIEKDEIRKDFIIENPNYFYKYIDI
jgi:predicted GIY-YIG superfamily endonuclease